MPRSGCETEADQYQRYYTINITVAEKLYLPELNSPLRQSSPLDRLRLTWITARRNAGGHLRPLQERGTI